MKFEQVKEAIERLVDASSADAVLCAFADVCTEKAEHLRTNWQDEDTALVWDKLARAVSKVPNLGF